MKIVEKEITRFTFGDICCGEVFCFDNSYYMKIELIVGSSITFYNAINLGNGEATKFESNCTVEPVICQLNIQ